MNQKYESLTIRDAFVLSKVVVNFKIAKKLMERLAGGRIHHISLEKKNIVEGSDGYKGICMELHFGDADRSVQRVELYLATKDIFKEGQAVYHFTETCKEVPALRLRNGVEKIYVCATSETAENASDPELQALLYYLLDAKDKRTNFIKMLDDEVGRVKSNSIYLNEYRRLQCEETEASQRAYAEYRQGRSKYKR